VRPVAREEILDIPSFVAARPSMERRAVEARRARRLAVGDHLSVCFENRVTVAWQVQEMCRVEGIRDEAAVRHELDTYNALLPGPAELSATLFVEYAEPPERDRQLRALVGIERHVRLDFEGASAAPAVFDDEQFSAERISAVQFVRFSLSSDQLDALRNLRRRVRLVVDHPALTTSASLSPALRGALVEDLETP
jgi:hypothetical protein